MGNNNLKTTNDVLVKVDQNNLIYIDPNSVLVNGVVEPRAVEPENLIMYVNLEADLVPRSVLTNDDNKNSLMSIAKGTLNFLKNKDGKDYDTKWTESYTDVKASSFQTLYTQKGIVPIPNSFRQTDETGQNFGIESISIQIKGANFIPRVVIKFIDVRGKTLFESPENSPYSAFFHLPWPIYYLTVKGYYGKAIKYRLHMVKFNSRYNSNNGNFEIETNFVGSTYAYLADISLESILNAPYFHASENVISTKYNEETKYNDVTISKSAKGYRILKSIYQEYINQGLLPNNFPVKTLREIIVIAGRLNKILENEIFPSVIDYKILSGVKEYESILMDFEEAILAWKGKYLSSVPFTQNKTRIDPISRKSELIQWFKLLGQEKNTLLYITGFNKSGTLEYIIYNFIDRLEKNEAFGTKKTNKTSKTYEIITNSISCAGLKNIKDFYLIDEGSVGVDIDGVLDQIYVIQKNFTEQRNSLENKLEQKMNEVVKDKNFMGFEPTIRNLIGVMLANAETYIRLMKDVHYKAFEKAAERRIILNGVITDSKIASNAIYPWPEIKAQTAGGKELVLMYPGCKEMLGKLQSDNKNLWPEVDFVENFYEIVTKKSDNLVEKESNTDNINFIYDSTIDTTKRDISVLTNIMNYIPYTNKSISSILYEIYERAKYSMSLTPFNNATIHELANIEYLNLKDQVIDDIDIVETLKRNVTSYSDLILQMESSISKYQYYVDQLPTIPYIADAISNDFILQKYDGNSQKAINSEYTNVSEFLKNYKAEEYRKAIYPFNSPTYLSYLDQSDSGFKSSNLNLNSMLYVNTPNDFISSPLSPLMWVKSECVNNIFKNTILIDGINKHILNTPYFHKQLYNDFIKTQSPEKYVGSAYLLLNSLPFKDLDETINYAGPVSDWNGTLISTMFREIGATHYIPYHMILKWGSIYHRYKKYINDGIDIIADVTDRIDRNLFFDNNAGLTYTGLTSDKTISENSESDIGFHPYYETIFHQIANNYGFFNTNLAVSDYADMIVSGVTKLYYQIGHNVNIWTSFIDESKFDDTDERYTLLPCNGYNYADGTNFILADQNNFRILWDCETGHTGEDYINYSGYTFPAYNEYFKLIGTTDTYSLSTNYRKVIDLIATFKPGILESFELAFLDFASEKLNEETPYKPYNVVYSKFQDLLKKIVSVTKDNNDSLYENDELLTKIKERQASGLVSLSNELLSNDNLIKLTISNPREIDNYVLGGFTNINVDHFSVKSYDNSQLTDKNKQYVELYLGEPLSGCTYYGDFFSINNIELNEDNIKQFRPLIYIYAGLRTIGETPTKSTFIEYVINNIVNTDIIFTSLDNSSQEIKGPTGRLMLFLDDLINKIQSIDFNIKSDNEKSFIKRGYNDDQIKLELYDYFKSFNDKWISGNSIGQRTLMEEFLFLDRANKDIGNSVYLDMEKLMKFEKPGNEKINLFSVISLLVQDTGFDIRALPAYVNFYGTNFSNTARIIPSKTVAQNMFGTFLDIDYQESSPKIILQYIGPTSKHLELSDIYNKYMYKNDGFDIGNVNKNSIIVAPDVFTKVDFSKSNKVVAFEVSFGDQNQSIFKGVELDQSSIKNTTESFEVLERLGRSETGASTAQIDIGLFDVYRSSSYQCQVTAMGNVMIQPTMYFYLKNIPMFRGSYWITEVTHDIKTTGIQTSFKGTRIPQQSLPNPSDSFMSSYRSLFDKLVKKANIKVNDEHTLSGATGTEKTIITSMGSYTINMDNANIPGESIIQEAGLTSYGISYNGYDGEKDIQFVRYQGRDWLRARAVLMGGNIYKIDNSIHMNIVSNLKIGGKTLTWGDVKDLSEDQNFYVSKFDIYRGCRPDDLISKYAQTEFLIPNIKSDAALKEQVVYCLKTNIDVNIDKYEGPISVGPSTTPVLDAQGYLAPGYGIGMSKRLMRNLGLSDGDVVYFRLS